MTIAGYTVAVKLTGTAVAVALEPTTEVVTDTTYQVTDANKRIIDPTVAVVAKDLGSSTVISGEALTTISGDATYQITNAAHRVLDPSVDVVLTSSNVGTIHMPDFSVDYPTGTITIVDTPHPLGTLTLAGAYFTPTVIDAADVEVDYLFGKVTLASPPTGPVTLSYSYLPVLTAAETREFSVSMSRTELETTIHGQAARTYILGPKMAEGTFGSLDVGSTDIDPGGDSVVPETLLSGAIPKLLEITIGARFFRAWILLTKLDLTAKFEDLVQSTLSWKCSAIKGNGQDQYASFGFGS